MVPQGNAQEAARHGLRRDRHRVRLVLQRHGCRRDGRRDDAQVMPVEDAEISAIARKQLEKQGMKIMTEAKVTKVDKGPIRSPRPCRDQGRQDAGSIGRPADFRRRRGRQHRESRPGGARREDRPRLHRHRRLWQDQCRGHLRHRRCRRPADAGPQGRA
jgi:hypothetical protein